MLMSTTEGAVLLRNPSRNKGTAFTAQEREEHHLRGLLPPRVFTLQEQVERTISNVRRKATPIEKYLYLMNLYERNQVLFYRVLIDNMAELMPIVYTPTVGQACQEYSKNFIGAHGMYISIEDAGDIERILGNWPEQDIRVIVVTDGERILGLGDLGANGMGIPVGKLALYSACAGIHPEHCLPVTIDVGTNNSEFLNDPLYIGLRQPRLRGEQFDALIEEFVTAVQHRFPHAIIQFEDFGNRNAFRLLEHYRHISRSFNDDIQGTAAVTLAGIYSAMRITGQSLKDQTLVFLGAGEAGIGIADLFVSALKAEGVPEGEARRKCWFVDSKGLVCAERTDLQDHKRPYAHLHRFIPSLLEVVELVKPTALVGVSGMPQTFTQPIVEAMGRFNDRPTIFSLSNPTSKSECTAEQAYRWTEGRAIFASGSPFDAVTYDGKTLVPGQGNNSYIFPGVGLGVMASGARRVTDEMFAAAAKTLAETTSQADLDTGCIFPALSRIREVSAQIAYAVAEIAYKRDLCEFPRPKDLMGHIHEIMFDPQYE